MKCLPLRTFLGCLILVSSSLTEARQFRQLAPIPVAPQVLEQHAPEGGLAVGAPANLASLDSTLSPVGALQPLGFQMITDSVNEIIESWNTSGLTDYLDQYFPNRFQLVDVLARDIPEDARLQVLSVQNTQTLSQFWGSVRASGQRTRVSQVSTTVSLQLRFNDPVRGLITLPHTAQFYLRIVETESSPASLMLQPVQPLSAP